MRYTINQLQKIIMANNESQPKAHYSNDALLTMLANAEKGDTIEAEPTRKGFVNRGSVAECLFKNAVLNYVLGTECQHSVKNSDAEIDLDTRNLDSEMLKDLGLPKALIEIKFSTNFSKASPKKNSAEYVVVINENGAWLVKSNKLNLAKTGHVMPKQPNGKYLTVMNEILGFAA